MTPIPFASSSSRASTPESPLGKAATTIDDLMIALSNFSRAPTPDALITCCCRQNDCEAAMLWTSLRTKLESRLVLSAEVGQALLQRHEEYVRRQDPLSREASSIFPDVDDRASLRQQVERLTKKLDTLTEENSLMESRINELLIKNEMSEASNRTIMQELQEARANVKRLSTQHTRSIGWEMRLSQQTQENEDLRQERDSEAHRAKLAESKAAAFVEKCSKLQNEVHTLRGQVHNFRTSRADFSKTVLQEARTRLEALQHSLGRDQTREDPETTRVFESLVADNETLKRDVAELQNLLVEAREDVRTLSEELEEHRALAPSIDDFTRAGPPSPSVIYHPRTSVYGHNRGHHPSPSLTSTSSVPFTPFHGPVTYTPMSRVVSPGFRYHRRSLSGSARLSGDGVTTEWSLMSPTLPHSQSRHGGDLDLESRRTPSPLSPKTNVKSLLLLSRSRGVQTDPQPETHHTFPSPRPSTLGVDRDGSLQAGESHSDASSISQQDPRAAGLLAVLTEKVAGLLVQMTQADVRTLTNRLKRQHLLAAGGDARHVSRSTIGSIVNEVANLRAPALPGEDSAASSPSLTVTRGDIKALLKLFKAAFTELGMLREQLNEVIFDPVTAHRLRKEALEPERAKGEPRPPSAMSGWIAPIQKLFMGQTPTQSVPLETDVLSAASGGANKPPPDLGRGKPSTRVVPKLAPAISASSTTVKVEFASSGVRKTGTSEGSIRVLSPVGVPPAPQPHVTGPTILRKPVAVSYSTSQNLMNIFAGAPQSGTNPPSGQPWQVVPKANKDRTRQVRGAVSSARLREPNARNGGVGTVGRSAMTRNLNRLSRNVDAVIDQKDDQISEFGQRLLERTLRPRGLSDSSIHTTFLLNGQVVDSTPEKHLEANGGLLSVEPLTLASSPSTVESLPSSPPKAMDRPYPVVERQGGARSPVARLGQSLASWATAATGRPYNGNDDLGQSDTTFLFGSPREDGSLHYAAWGRRGLEDRDV